MPSKRKKFDSRFPAAKIKKIMQLDENIGKVASTVPIVISQALESFLKCFLLDIVDKNPNQRVKTLSPQLVKESTLQNPRWNFLEKLMASVPDQKQSVDIYSNKPNTSNRISKNDSLAGENTVSSDDEDHREIEKNSILTQNDSGSEENI